jgi:SIR2-like domain
MIPDDFKKTILPYLGDRLEAGSAILFPGAGFSLDVKNMRGEALPSGEALKKVLWTLCFGDEPLQQESTLQDVFTSAQIRQPIKMTSLLRERFTVAPESIPDYYQNYFSAPWTRIYSTNIDTLASAASTKFNLPRRIKSVSATTITGEGAFTGNPGDLLEFVHLNGTLDDLPNDVTFSRSQYGSRAGQQDPWYASFVSQLLSHCVIFVGSKLDESSLWQHIQMRQMRGDRRLNELRPRSYLVTPNLDRAKQDLLQQFNIVWIPATAEEFSVEILTPLRGRSLAGLSHFRTETQRIAVLQLVSQLAVNPNQNSEFLLGEEPIWADIQSGRAIEREHDIEVGNLAVAALSTETPGVLVVTGTAGTGKSTALMRVALRLSADGFSVGWIDKDADIALADIRRIMRKADRPRVLAIDDADLYGRELTTLCAELSQSEAPPLMILGVRSGKIEKIIDESSLSGTPYRETAVPYLSDQDIGKLIAVLDSNNRLGSLKGMSKEQQYARFREVAGRQLLVAMLSATSALPFREKPIQEFDELGEESRSIYATICVASAFRYTLTRAEIVMACGSRSNTALNSLDSLVRRHIVTALSDGSIRARHRVIAELVLDELQKDGELRPILEGLAFVVATQITQNTPRTARSWRLLRQLLNHDFLFRSLLVHEAQLYFAALEGILSWNFHYWLQRGSLEVEQGSLNRAENFLSQAKGLAPDDVLVQTEWAYLLFRKAIDNPSSKLAPDYVSEATDTLIESMGRSLSTEEIACHILGSQGLIWARYSLSDKAEKKAYLELILMHVKRCNDKSPRNQHLSQVLSDLKRELLLIAVF